MTCNGEQHRWQILISIDNLKIEINGFYHKRGIKIAIYDIKWLI